MRGRVTPILCVLAVWTTPASAGDLPDRLLEAPAILGRARVDDQKDALSRPLPPEPDSPVEPVTRRSRKPADSPVRLRRLSESDPEPVRQASDSQPVSRRSENADYDEIDDFLNRRSSSRTGDRVRRRSSEKFGDRFRDLFSTDRRTELFFSDHAFDGFATPISNPFLFEDPRSLTEIRPLFIYQNVPKKQPNLQGGDVYFLGARGSIAFTEWLSLTVNKLGAVSINPAGKSQIPDEFGFAELWLGPKVTFYRDPQFGTILAAGTIFQIPVGDKKVFQDTGRLSVTPYLSVGKTLTEFRRLGTLNAIATTGYAFSTDRDRSDYYYLSGHLDFDLFNRQRFYPIMEFNYFQYTTNGRANKISGEGHDLINFGGRAKGASLVTGALGARFKIIEAAQIGAAFEIPLFGNRDVFNYRFTVDAIFRY